MLLHRFMVIQIDTFTCVTVSLRSETNAQNNDGQTEVNGKTALIITDKSAYYKHLHRSMTVHGSLIGMRTQH